MTWRICENCRWFDGLPRPEADASLYPYQFGRCGLHQVAENCLSFIEGGQRVHKQSRCGEWAARIDVSPHAAAIAKAEGKP
jgi:hypothetical protein